MKPRYMLADLHLSLQTETGFPLFGDDSIPNMFYTEKLTIKHVEW